MVYVFSIYGFLSLITFCVYGLDKSAAKRGKQRVRESTLHFLSLFGGWFGALLGQKVFRHKTKKMRFLVVFCLTVVVNVTTTGYAVYFFQFS
jgi:uncharacterized membrane protein YsdA (DUF1294 family)